MNGSRGTTVSKQVPWQNARKDSLSSRVAVLAGHGYYTTGFDTPIFMSVNYGVLHRFLQTISVNKLW